MALCAIPAHFCNVRGKQLPENWAHGSHGLLGTIMATAALVAAMLSFQGVLQASPALANEEQHVCWEKTVGPHSVCEQQEAASYNAVTVHAYSESTGFCVWRTIPGT